MNKKILISLSVIGVVAAIAISGTIAYFSDTETSVGNTFTAGSLDLTIDNECYYNGLVCKIFKDDGYKWQLPGPPDPAMPDPFLLYPHYLQPCSCTWELSDLDGKLFFEFSDLKPGDWGEDTVSLHVTNDAWACVRFDNLVSADNTCTEPEGKAENDPDPGECDEPGELANELFFGFWIDDGDNIWQDEEPVLMYGYASEILPGPKTYILADSTENNVGSATGYLEEGETYYIGKAWCYGEPFGYSPEEGLLCNGEPVTNISQTDSLSGDIIFYAEQHRNNPKFQCVLP